MPLHPSVKKENYITLANFIVVSFERDLADFTNHFKTMNSDYLAKFKEAIEAAKNIESTVKLKLEQKETTKLLYDKADELRLIFVFLKKYARNSDFETEMLSKTIQLLRTKNIEGSVNAIRKSLSYYQENKERMMDMPDNFLDEIKPKTDELEKLNIRQNIVMNQIKEVVNNENAKYETLYGYISHIASLGKLIYQGNYKKDEYNISKIIKRMKASDKKKEKPTEE